MSANHPHRTDHRTPVHWILLLCLMLVLGGCSSTRFAYQQLDWVITWWVEDYIPLNGTQEAYLERRIPQHLAWHCREELPRYARWLASVDTLVNEPVIRTNDVAEQQKQLFDALDRLLVEIAPTASGLLATLDDRQVQALANAMADHQQEDRDEFLGDDPDTQRDRREERTRERAEHWLGPLTSEQRRTIATWNQARGNQTAIWLDGRARWQAALLTALENRRADGFEDRVRHLLLHSSEVRGPEYVAMLARSRQAITQLITDLLNQATADQRAHLRGEIAHLQSDVRALTCNSDSPPQTPTSPPASSPTDGTDRPG